MIAEDLFVISEEKDLVLVAIQRDLRFCGKDWKEDVGGGESGGADGE